MILFFPTLSGAVTLTQGSVTKENLEIVNGRAILVMKDRHKETSPGPGLPANYPPNAGGYRRIESFLKCTEVTGRWERCGQTGTMKNFCIGCRVALICIWG